ITSLQLVSALSLSLAGLLATGCATSATAPEPAHSSPKPPTEKNDKGPSPSRLAQSDDTIDAQADAYAQRLAQALEARNNPGSSRVIQPNEATLAANGTGIEWVNPQHLRTASAPKPEPEVKNATPPIEPAKFAEPAAPAVEV